MSAVKILAFSGSLRRQSWNQKLVAVAAAGAREAGAEVTLVSLADFPMPLYNQEIEDAGGLPEQAKRFKELMKAHHGFLIASPEYNSSISAALKNAIDWTSRKEGDEPGLAAFVGKTAGLMSASPGALGGLRGLVHLRAILGNISTLVIPDQQALSQAQQAFEADGSIKDSKVAEKVKRIGARLFQVSEKLLG